MDIKRIELIQRMGDEAGWSFDRRLAEMRQLGVSRIRMKLTTGETEYTDDEGATLILSPKAPVKRECTEEIDGQALESARRRFLRNEIDLPTLFDLVAAAGVWYYELDTLTGTVKHYDWREQLQDEGYISC